MHYLQIVFRYFLCLKELNLSLLYFSLKTPKRCTKRKVCVWHVHLPKKRACSSRGRCKAQSSLTLWSTTISVIKITAMLHLRIITHKSSECTQYQLYLLHLVVHCASFNAWDVSCDNTSALIRYKRTIRKEFCPSVKWGLQIRIIYNFFSVRIHSGQHQSNILKLLVFSNNSLKQNTLKLLTKMTKKKTTTLILKTN